MTNIVVAYHIPHNDGLEYAIFTEPDQDTDLTLVDLYEVDGRIRTFSTVEEAENWLSEYGLTDIKPNEIYHQELRLCVI